MKGLPENLDFSNPSYRLEQVLKAYDRLQKENALLQAKHEQLMALCAEAARWDDTADLVPYCDTETREQIEEQARYEYYQALMALDVSRNYHP